MRMGATTTTTQRKNIAIVLIFLIIGLVSLQSQEYQEAHDVDAMTVAVSPFQNVGPKEDDDYVGFLISEFLASTMSSFEGIDIVERSRLQQVLEEQKLQLSGLTRADTTAEVGRLLNAGQMVVGSFAQMGKRLMISGRIVEVESGKVVASHSTEGVKEGGYMPLFRSFLFQLISNLPEYRVTIPVQAKVDSVEQQDLQASENYAKALKELFADNEKDALEYLQKSIGETEVDFIRFDEMSREYTETLQRVEGSGIFTKMIQNQVEHNRRLTSHIEPLSLQRSTLKILTDRVSEQLKVENVFVEAKHVPEGDWKMGTVSLTIPPPQQVTVSLKEETKKTIDAYFSQQEILKPNGEGYTIAPLSRGELLNVSYIENLFSPEWAASMRYTVDYLNKEGEVVYQIESEPVTLYALQPDSSLKRAKGNQRYRATIERDGWTLKEGGAVEVQAKEIRSLHSIKVTAVPESFRRRVNFSLYPDHRWRSIITHAYRKKSVKILTEKDTAPAFKRVAVTDSWFYTGDPQLDPVPMLPRGETDHFLTGFSRLSGIVYFAEKAKGTIEGRWSGAVSGVSPVKTAEFTPDSVLIFDVPEHKEKILRGDITFTAEFEDVKKTAKVSLINGKSWVYEGKSWLSNLKLGEGVVYLGGYHSTAFRASDGHRMWSHKDVGSNVRLFGEYVVLFSPFKFNVLDRQNGRIHWQLEKENVRGIELSEELFYIIGDEAITAFEPKSGETVWRFEFRNGGGRGDKQLDLWGDTLYGIVEGTTYKGYDTFALDAETGTLLWGQKQIRGTDMQTNGDVVYVSTYERDYFRTYAFDAHTGKQLWETETGGKSISLDRGKVYVHSPLGTTELDRRTGSKTAYFKDAAELVFEPGRVYGTGRRSFAVDPTPGTYVWKQNDIKGDFILPYEDGLFICFQSRHDPGTVVYLDKSTGGRLWESGYGGRIGILHDNFLYLQGGRYLYALDLTALDGIR